MTKGAVLSMTLSVAKDYLSQGIRCYCISPARVHTPFVDGFVAKNYPGQEAKTMKALEAAGTAHWAYASYTGRGCDAGAVSVRTPPPFLTGVDFPIDGGFFNLR